MTVDHRNVTTVRGTPNATYYSGEWASNTRIHWATTGSFFEIVFTGHSLTLYGSTRSDHGYGRVFIDDVSAGTVTYRASNNNTVRPLLTITGLTDQQHTLRVDADGWVDHGWVEFTTGTIDVRDDLERLYDVVDDYAEGDHTATSWGPFAAAFAAATPYVTDDSGTAAERESARAALETASDALVVVRGLRDLVDDYSTRVPTDHTAESWAPFAAALTAAAAVLENQSASKADILAAKNGLIETASELVTTSPGSFETITNDTWWYDTDGNPIYSQGGGIFRFGDTYYWYGVNYVGASMYHASPTKTYNAGSEVKLLSIPVYSSQDLVNWKFENNVATQETELHLGDSATSYFDELENLGDADWMGRMGVAYNENDGTYVLFIQMAISADPNGTGGTILMLRGDSPTDDFVYANHQQWIVNNPSIATGDQTVFTDDDGEDYLIFSNGGGRNRTFVSHLDLDALHIEPGVQIGYTPGIGREGNAMFKLGDTYYAAASDLHGWNTSVNYVTESQSESIQGAYTSEYVLDGTERDYSHVTQTGFFVTIHGTERDTVLYAGDRWADFAWNGHGYNQWTPIEQTDEGLRFHSLNQWQLNAVTGEWRVGPNNDYVLNGDFQADRIIVSNLLGWEENVDADSVATSFIGNVNGGANTSRFSARFSATSAFSGSLTQDLEVPDGVYRLGVWANTAGGLEYARAVVEDGEGNRHEIDINQATGGWLEFSASDLPLSGGEVTVSIEARGAGGQSVQIDQVSLRRQTVDTAALQAVVDANEDRSAAEFSAATWQPFVDALDPARDVLASPTSTQSEVDAARAALEAASSALVTALVSIDLTTTRTEYAVGEAFDSAATTVTGAFADGSTRALVAEEFTFAGFTSDTVGDRTVTATAAAELAATGAAAVADSLAVRVFSTWNASTVYTGGESVIYDGSVWYASWWTQNQTPGPAYGPWQQIVTGADGIAVWTPTRIFVAGDKATYNGQVFTAKWWTRNQAPGNQYGPWAL